MVGEDIAEKRKSMGTSLVVQSLRLHAANAGGPGSMPGQEIGSHMPQLRVCMLQLRPKWPFKYIHKQIIF